MEIKLNSDVERNLENYLDFFEETLKTKGILRFERQSIVENVQSQIFELLETGSLTEPTTKDLRTIIDKLDPPDTYTLDEGSNQSEISLYQKIKNQCTPISCGQFALILSFYGALFPLLYALVMRLFFPHQQPSWIGVFFAFQAAAFYFGLKSRNKFLGKTAMILSGSFFGVLLILGITLG